MGSRADSGETTRAVATVAEIVGVLEAVQRLRGGYVGED